MLAMKRLTRGNFNDLMELSKSKDFPYKITGNNKYDIMTGYLNGDTKPTSPMVQTYGYYANVDKSDGTVNKELVGVMTATYMLVFPHHDSPSGRIVHISGAYVRPDMRHKQIATKLLSFIMADAETRFKADYLCCDSSANGFWLNRGFTNSYESRLWKPMRQEVIM